MKHARVWIKFGTERVSVAQAAKRIGVAQMTMWSRLRRGASQKELLAPGYGPRERAEIMQATSDHSAAHKRGIT